MACSGSHFPILIHKDIKEDHERCIAFSWNPNGLFIQAKDKSCQKMTMADDLMSNQKLIISLNLRKKNQVGTRIVDDFLVIGQSVY